MEYVPHVLLSTNIIKKPTVNLIISSLAEGEELAEKTSPFDSFIQIIDGNADVRINDELFRLGFGEGVTVPAHPKQCFMPMTSLK